MQFIELIRRTDIDQIETTLAADRSELFDCDTHGHGWSDLVRS